MSIVRFGPEADSYVWLEQIIFATEDEQALAPARLGQVFTWSDSALGLRRIVEVHPTKLSAAVSAAADSRLFPLVVVTPEARSACLNSLRSLSDVPYGLLDLESDPGSASAVMNHPDHDLLEHWRRAAEGDWVEPLADTYSESTLDAVGDALGDWLRRIYPEQRAKYQFSNLELSDLRRGKQADTFRLYSWPLARLTPRRASGLSGSQWAGAIHVDDHGFVARSSAAGIHASVLTDASLAGLSAANAPPPDIELPAFDYEEAASPDQATRRLTWRRTGESEPDLEVHLQRKTGYATVAASQSSAWLASWLGKENAEANDRNLIAEFFKRVIPTGFRLTLGQEELASDIYTLIAEPRYAGAQRDRATNDSRLARYFAGPDTLHFQSPKDWTVRVTLPGHPDILPEQDPEDASARIAALPESALDHIRSGRWQLIDHIDDEAGRWTVRFLDQRKAG